MSTLVAAQITAIATVLLAVGAIAAAIVAAVALSKQSWQVEQLKKQVAQEALDRRRAQAAHVFIWQGRVFDAPSAEDAAKDPSAGLRSRFVAYVQNASDQPVYDVRITWRIGELRPDVRKVRVVMPGAPPATSEKLLPPEWPGWEVGGPRAEVTFRDAAGVSWFRTPDGELTELKDAEKEDGEPTGQEDGAKEP